MIRWCSDSWVSQGQVCYVPRHGGWDNRDINDRDRWPRVRGDQIKDEGYDPTRWYAIPIAMFLVVPLEPTVSRRLSL